MADIEIEWKDIEKKVEEDKLKDAKSAQEQLNIKAEQNADAETERKANADAKAPINYEPIGLASLVSEVWNEIAVGKGYDGVSELQMAFLNKHSTRLEQKYLADKANLMPEIEAGLSHIVVYVPKWLKFRRTRKTTTKK